MPATPEAHVPSAREEARSLARERRALLLQAPWILGSAAALVIGAGALRDAPLDLQFLLLAATGIFSLAAIHWVDQLCTLLTRECPRCAEPFFGTGGEQLPTPLRRRCCHCGLAADGTGPDRPETRDLG